MRRSRTPLLLSLPLLLLLACDPSSPAVDAGGGSDAGFFDGGLADGGGADAGPITIDAGLDGGLGDGGADGGGGPPGFGSLGGACGSLTMMALTSSEPSVYESVLDFADDPYDDTDFSLLSAGGQEILVEGTAGGSSGLSEAFAFEALHRCEGAALVKTETEIVYDAPGSITDILVEIEGLRIGVSVTRAFGFPPEDPYTIEDAQPLLTRKLEGILESTMNVSAEDAWVKQILVVVAYEQMHVESFMAAWDAVTPELRADTVLYLVRTDGADMPLY